MDIIVAILIVAVTLLFVGIAIDATRYPRPPDE